ncbi:hypothetical protein [Helicobacter bilis]|nr:hypothetical protein [Helicobacter bilis]
MALTDSIATLEALHKAEKEVLEMMIVESSLSNSLGMVYVGWTKTIC